VFKGALINGSAERKGLPAKHFDWSKPQGLSPGATYGYQIRLKFMKNTSL
jgi:hypothetical protein